MLHHPDSSVRARTARRPRRFTSFLTTLLTPVFAACACGAMAAPAAAAVVVAAHAPAAHVAPDQEARAKAARAPRLPSVALTDETGRTVRLDDLSKDHVVAMNFIFTSCSTICQPMSATFAQVEKRLGSRPVRLVSISIDPDNDTPARLAEWKARFQGGAAWTLLTGAREDIDRLRKTLGVYTADAVSHTPTTVLLDERSGRSTRLNGLVQASDVITAIDTLTSGAPAAPASPGTSGASGASPSGAPAGAGTPGSPGGPAAAQAAAHDADSHGLREGAGKYFGGLSLVDQDGRTVRLFEDVIAGHVVLLHTFFASCQGSCPVMTGTLVNLQKRFADRLGGALRFVSITVDPRNDTPEKLREYAARVHARDGWLFLTGSQAEVDAALKKIGQYAVSPEGHANVMIVGNEPTGLWKKVFGLSTPEAIGDIVQGVLEDRVAAGAGR